MAEQDNTQAGPAPQEGRSNALALLGFGVSAASTVFMNSGEFTVFAAPVGAVLLLITLHYEPEMPVSGPGGWAFALVQAIAVVMIVGWVLNSIVQSEGDDRSFVQIGATAVVTVLAHLRRTGSSASG